MTFLRIVIPLYLFVEHDLSGKPLHTFPDHALVINCGYSGHMSAARKLIGFSGLRRTLRFFALASVENCLICLGRHQEHVDFVSLRLPDALGETNSIVRIGQPVVEQCPPSSRTVTPAKHGERFITIAARLHHDVP